MNVHTLPAQALMSRVQQLEAEVETTKGMAEEDSVKLHATEEANAVLRFEMEQHQKESEKLHKASACQREREKERERPTHNTHTHSLTHSLTRSHRLLYVLDRSVVHSTRARAHTHTHTPHISITVQLSWATGR